MTDPRWLVDEMLGRLARYLRFLGYDAEYARGESDDALRRRARAEGRILVTRDRALASRTPGAVCLASTAIDGQWRELRAQVPDLGSEVRFVRCSRCNGALRPVAADALDPSTLPRERSDRVSSLHRCDRCGHVYWEGTHTAAIRESLRRWSAPSGGGTDAG